MTPMGDGMDNGKEFTVIDLIVTFSRAKGFRKIEAWVIISVVVFLEKNSSHGNKRSIGGNSELLLRVRITKDRGGAEGFFNFTKSIFLGL